MREILNSHMNTKYQNQYPDLPSLNVSRYENIFKIGQNAAGKKFYNLLQNITFPSSLSDQYFFTYVVDRSIPLTALSYMMYETTDLWWLICTVNNISNPVEFIPPGTVLKIIKQSKLPVVLDEIQLQLT